MIYPMKGHEILAWAIEDPERALRTLESKKGAKDLGWSTFSFAKLLEESDEFWQCAGVKVDVLDRLFSEVMDIFPVRMTPGWIYILPSLKTAPSFARLVRFLAKDMPTFESEFLESLADARAKLAKDTDEFNETCLPIGSLAKSNLEFCVIKDRHGPRLQLRSSFDGRRGGVKTKISVLGASYTVLTLANRLGTPGVGRKYKEVPAELIEPSSESEILLAFLEGIQRACNEV